VELNGEIGELIGEGGMGGRGPGIDISLATLPQSVLWLIESALTSAGITPRPVSKNQDTPTPPVSTPPVSTPPVSTPPIEESHDLNDGDPLVAAEGDLVKALWQELASMSKMNPFQLLELPYTANDQEVRAAFGGLSKKYHPDRFTRYESFEIRELANEVFILLRDAYGSLAKEESRRAALQSIDPEQKLGAAETRPQPTPTPPPIPAAAMRSTKLLVRPNPPAIDLPPPKAPVTPASGIAPRGSGAKDARKSSQFATVTPSSRAGSAPLAPAKASTAATTAATTDGSNRVSMAMNILESGQYEQALRILRTEARKDPNNITANAGVELAEGRLALVSGNRMEAAERFEAALDIDPSNERAAREIADMRRHATSQRRGLLSKLMKKV